MGKSVNLCTLFLFYTEHSHGLIEAQFLKVDNKLLALVYYIWRQVRAEVYGFVNFGDCQFKSCDQTLRRDQFTLDRLRF